MLELLIRDCDPLCKDGFCGRTEQDRARQQTVTRPAVSERGDQEPRAEDDDDEEEETAEEGVDDPFFHREATVLLGEMGEDGFISL